jgi:hypothetical protein
MAHKIQTKRQRRPRAPKASGRKSEDFLVTTELEPREDLCVRTVAEQYTRDDRGKR